MSGQDVVIVNKALGLPAASGTRQASAVNGPYLMQAHIYLILGDDLLLDSVF